MGKSSARIRSVTTLTGLVLVVTGSVIPTERAVAATIAFGKSTLAGTSLQRPTSLQFGPDGRLYVLERDGLLKVYSVARNGLNNYAVTSAETIPLIQQIPNHDDNGTVNPAITTRLATGLVVAGTAQSPVIYVSSSDPRYGGGDRGDLNLDTNSGMVSRLTRSNGSWQREDLVRGLPRSEENHAPNGMALDRVANRLYLAVGGHTNMGAPSRIFAQLPEYALSAAILSIDLGRIGSTTYDIPTLDDDTRAGTVDANDPFGGNDGRNQSLLVPGGPVQVYSPGYRNPYDVLIASTGKMFSADNGHNAGQGNVPIGEGPGGTCTNAVNEPGVTGPDSIHLIGGPGYYGGHPNPTRGNMGNTFSGGQSPVSTANPIECDYRARGTENGAIATDPSSTNGLTEYTTDNFSGALKGDILLAAYDNYIIRLHLSSDGTSVLSQTRLFSSVGVHPLDVVALGDGDPFPGTIWVADVSTSKVYVFEPNDYGGAGGDCSATDDAAVDEDNDGYDNADEIDSGTDPCSAADVPPDWDSDRTSNLNDPDDDNDGNSDRSDPFAIDPANGGTTPLPVTYTFDEATPNAGGLLDLGFTGLMTNGTSNYESLYDPTLLTAGGAPGVLTVDKVTEGDATGQVNTQEYGFQFGVDVAGSSAPFTAHTRIISPFAGMQPAGQQSMGLAIGTGTQQDYVKIVTTAGGGTTGVKALKEVGGTVTQLPKVALEMPGPDAVDLFLLVDPATSTVQPSFRVVRDGVVGPRTSVGAAAAIPPSWISGTSGLAVGVISTSAGPGDPFPATWDLIEVTNTGIGAPAQPDGTIKLSSDASALGNDVYNSTGQSQTRHVVAARGNQRRFLIRVHNDGPRVDSFTVSGPGGDSNYSVRYLQGAKGTTDITSQVTSGTYRMANVAAGGSRVIRLVVTVRAAATLGTVRKWLVSARSVTDTNAVDVIGGQVKVSG